MNITITRRDNIRPISLDAPNMSPVAYLKLLLVIKTMISPATTPPIIPMTPMYSKDRNPKRRVKIIETVRSFQFIFFIKYCPVPSSRDFENVAQLTKLSLAAISDVKSAARM